MLWRGLEPLLFALSRPTLFDRCRRKNREVKPSLDFDDGRGGVGSRDLDSSVASGLEPSAPEFDSSTIFGIRSMSCSFRSRIALTRIPLAVIAVTFTEVMSPTPTLFSHHCSIALTPDAAGGHLYTRSAVPSSTQYTRRHFLSFACTPGRVNSTFRGIAPQRKMEFEYGGRVSRPSSSCGWWDACPRLRNSGSGYGGGSDEGSYTGSDRRRLSIGDVMTSSGGSAGGTASGAWPSPASACDLFGGVLPSVGEMILSFSLRETETRSIMLFDAWWYRPGRGEPGVAGIGTMRGCGTRSDARALPFERTSLARGVRVGEGGSSGDFEVK